MEKTTEIRPPIGYYGSKWGMRKVIIEMFPPHDTYVEVFGGSGVILLNKPRSLSKRGEVYNDLDDDLGALFKVIRDNPDDLNDLLDITLYRRQDYEESVKALKSHSTESDLDKARRFFLVANASLCGGGKPLYTSSFRTSRKGGMGALGFKNKLTRIDIVHERLRNVVIENMDCLRVIDRYDDTNTFFYIDPPYDNVQNTYRFGMAPEHHEALCERLGSLKGLFILSGYDNSIYSKRLDRWCFKHVHKQRNVSKSNVPGRGRPKESVTVEEVLWSNFEYTPD